VPTPNALRKLGKLRILEERDLGGHASVCRAEDELLRRKVTLVILGENAPSEFRERFLQRARAAGGLSHPAIAMVVDAGEQDGRVFVAYETGGAPSLHTRLAEGSQFAAGVVSVAERLADALRHAHSRGVTHGWLSSQTVMVGEDGCPRIVGFGLGRLASETEPASDLRALGGILAESLAAASRADRTRARRLARIGERLRGESGPPFASAGDVAAELRAVQRKSVRRVLGPRTRAVAALIAVAVGAVVTLHLRNGTTRYASVAVLPFGVGVAAPTEASLWAHGIGEAIATKLGGLDGLRVTPWVTSQGYSADVAPVPQICRELGVETVVTGEVRLGRGSIAGEVRLLATDGAEVWGTAFDEPLSGVLRVQAEIARSVAARLRGRLTGSESAVLERELAANIEAYRCYLQASAELARETPESNEVARVLYGRCLELDPGFVPAYVGLGAAHSNRAYNYWDHDPDDVEVAEQCFRKALALDPGNLRALRGLVRTENTRGRYGAMLELTREAKAEPSSVESLMFFGEAFLLGGMARTSLPIFERILELDPANVAGRFFRMVALCWLGRFEECIDAGNEFLRRNGEDAQTHFWLGAAWKSLGDLENALAHYQRAHEMVGANAWVELADTLRRLGRTDEADRIFRAGLADLRSRLATGPDERAHEDLVWAAAHLGDRRAVADVEARVGDDDLLGILDWATPHVLLGDPEGARERLERTLARGRADDQMLYMTALAQGGLRDLLDRPEHADLRARVEETLEEMRRRYVPPELREICGP